MQVRTVVLGLLLALGGCVEDDEPGFAQLPCDTRAAACQEAVYQATAETAQLPSADQPPIRVISVDQLEDALRAELERERESEDLAVEQSWTTALQLLGLVPAGQDVREAAIAHSVQEISAFYDSREKQVSVVDRGAEDPEQDLLVLSHELAHALRDAESDLGAFHDRHATSTDSAAAVSSLIEGEAMVVGVSVVARAFGGPGAVIDWERLSDRLEQNVLATIDEASSPLIAAAQGLPYAYGTRALARSWENEGRAIVDQLFAEPRLRLLEWSLGTLSGPVSPLTCFPTSPPPGYVGHDSDTLGVAGLLALQVALGSDDASGAMSASEFWRDDRMVVFRPDGQDGPERAVAWRIRLASAPNARVFENALRSNLPPDVQLDVMETELLVTAASDPSVLAAWTTRGDCGAREDVPVVPRDAD